MQLFCVMRIDLKESHLKGGKIAVPKRGCEKEISKTFFERYSILAGLHIKSWEIIIIDIFLFSTKCALPLSHIAEFESGSKESSLTTRSKTSFLMIRAHLLLQHNLLKVLSCLFVCLYQVFLRNLLFKEITGGKFSDPTVFQTRVL